VWSRLATTLAWAGREAEAADVVQRAVRAGIWSLPAQRPSSLVRALRASPWHAAHAYDELLVQLRAAHGRLLGELHAAQRERRLEPQPEGLQRPGERWDVLDIGAACASPPEASSRLHFSCALLRRLRREGAVAAPPYAPLKAQFSTMAAGVHVRPHTGPTNAKLTIHYGLDVPVGATIRVADEARAFVQHGLLVFDDSFEHEVWQNGTTDRTTLVLHVAHPDLTEELTHAAFSAGT